MVLGNVGANDNWRELLADLPHGTQAEQAESWEQAVFLVRCELDLIEEGQEAADNYSPAQVRKIRKWLAKHDKFFK